MKIEGEYKKHVKLSELNFGATFVHEGQLFVKIVAHPIVMSTMPSLSNAAINLETNMLVAFNGSIKVLPVSAKIVIE